MEQRSPAILICGAGPTGLAIANLLGQYNIETLLIERNQRLCEFPRAIAIDDEGLRICQALGLHKEVLAHVRLDLTARYLSARGHLLVHAAPRRQHYGYPLISTFDQIGLEAALLAGLARFPCVHVRFGHTLETFVQTEQGVLATVRTASEALIQISCAYLLACDGGKSTVRHILDIPLRGTTFPQRWLVIDSVLNKQVSSACITFFCDPARPAVSVPAPGKGWRWEFMLRPGEREEEFCTPANLRHLLQCVGGPPEPQIVRQAIYTFHAASATAFSRGRVFLLGDAAHLLPPFGGQGMNSGLRDAHNLAWKLALVLRAQASPVILATYQQERAPHVRRMLRFSSFLGSAIMPTSRPLAFMRDITLRSLMHLPPLVSALSEARIKPEPIYKRGMFLSERHLLQHPLAGQLLPQPLVETVEEGSHLLDEHLGADFALLRLHTNPRQAFKALQANLWHTLKTRFICIVPTKDHLYHGSQDCISVWDARQQLARFLRGRGDLFVLVRPDRYVMGTFRQENEHIFVAALEKRLFRK